MISHTTGDGIGIELFEFSNTVAEEKPFEYWRPGLFHFCVQDADVEGRVKIIESLGGKQRTQQIRKYFPAEKPYRMVYRQDPFGNIFELYSHSYELTYSAGAYA